MIASETAHHITSCLPGIPVALSCRNAGSLEINAIHLREVAQFLKDEEALSFDFLICLIAVDYMSYIELIYHLHSYRHNHQVALRTRVSRNTPLIESLTSLYPAANWHEREIFDLYGVTFANHPDLTRLLLPDDWEGYPMRRDYCHENLIRRPENE